MKSSDIRAALARKYCPPEWFIAYEVANDTGTRANRYADAVALSIWPSRGYRLEGFEVKVSRSDFMAEMKAPDKADAVMQHCDYWWLVVPKNMVAPEEVPLTWGLMDLTDAGLRVRRMAPKLDPEPVTRGFMAALLRRSTNLAQAHIQEAIAKGEAEREARLEKEVERRTRDLREKLDKHAQWARDFEAAFGERPRSYVDPAKFAATIRAAEKLCGEWGALERVAKAAEGLVTEIEAFSGARETTGAEVAG